MNNEDTGGRDLRFAHLQIDISATDDERIALLPRGNSALSGRRLWNQS